MFYLYKCIRSSEIEYFDQDNMESFSNNYAETMSDSDVEEFTNNDVEEFANNDMVFRMFHVKWCGYCTKAKPDYMKFMAQSNGKVVNGRTLRVEMIDCEESKANADLAKSLGVKGYPTFILSKNGTNTNYEGGDRSPKGFLSWVKSLVN